MVQLESQLEPSIMLYGYNTKPRTTLVVAGHTDLEFRAWYGHLMAATGTPLYSEARETDMFEHLMNDDWADLKTTIYEFKFDNDHNQAEFARLNDIEIMPRANAVDKNLDMDYRSNDNYDTEKRTIEEITGTDKHDPWDTTSDEDKAKAKALKDMMKQKQQNDEVSNDDSFSSKGKAGEGGVYVDGIQTSTDANGNIVVDNVNAVKYDGNEVERSLEEIERVKQQEYAAGRNPVLDSAVIVDLTLPKAVPAKKPRAKKQ